MEGGWEGEKGGRGGREGGGREGEGRKGETEEGRERERRKEGGKEKGDREGEWVVRVTLPLLRLPKGRSNELTAPLGSHSPGLREA